MISIILKDNKNKLFEVIRDLREETELLICNNIITINNNINQTLSIETFVEGIDKYWVEKGYNSEPGLYDKLIIEYNQNNTPLLTRWK
ncbi:hypothetical protein FPG87_02735 [Flavobacterium psychrophilum]|uniref:Uncharacterized protein n=1 Tax=Flavobacterium psychrophilum TaxID=96345 RepID=A0A7U2RB06_FLAPS|nr:hypothetical protein [Flavobacterium psychrophilum]OAE90540.1 hypothetical protein SU65_12445 [Flavobacterium psychrophilum]OJH13819.1 hypothetical protein FPG87_02735 [Flavobacterium psychrophilum]QRE04864.1 hypothetical protein H0H26_04555 [Flavobacterium psychrophilum]